MMNHETVTQRRSVAKRVGGFQRRLFVSVFVCLFVNTITPERVNMTTKLWGLVHCTKISTEFELGGHSPLGADPQ